MFYRPRTSPTIKLTSTQSPQTAAIIDSESGFVKTELRGHENVIEAVAFVPVNAVPAVRELVPPSLLSSLLR